MSIEFTGNIPPLLPSVEGTRSQEGERSASAARLARLVTEHLECNNVTTTHDLSNVTVNATAIVNGKTEASELEAAYKVAMEKLVSAVSAKATIGGNLAHIKDTEGPFGAALKWLGQRTGEVAKKSREKLPPAAVHQLLNVDKLGLSREDFVSFLIAFDLSRDVGVTFTDQQAAEMDSLFKALIGRLTNSPSVSPTATVNQRMSAALQDLTTRLADIVKAKSVAG